MDRRDALVGLLLVGALWLTSRPAAAGYAYPTPPTGFQGASGATPNRWLQSANAGRFVNGSLSTAVTLNVGGRAVTMPASVRVAANAARYVAPAIRVLGGPAAIGVGIAAWLASNYISWNDEEQRWETQPLGNTTVTGYQVNTFTVHSTAAAACTAWAADGGFYGRLQSNGSLCAAENPNNPGQTLFVGVVNQVPMTVPNPAHETSDEEWEGVEFSPMPPAVIPDLEPLGIPVPIELPALNPSDDPVPLPQPLRVPEGAPVPVPGTDPAEWRQPVTDIVPKPVTESPWRVDVQPKIVPSPDAEGLNDPEVIADPNAGNPTPNPENATDCDKYPEASGCKPLDTPSGSDELPQTSVPVSILPDGGWGADNASCPAARSVTVQGRLIPIPFDLFCQYFSGLRYVVIAMAWLGAGFILLGARSD